MELSSISFTPLHINHFPLLLKWLKMPHVKAWWDQDVDWTPELIKEKYESYVDGYKVEKDAKKPFYAYIIYVADIPMGYIQLYNAYDFPRDTGYLPQGLPKSLGALDFFIGDPSFIGKGLAFSILAQFLQNHVSNKFDACFVDPDSTNQKAIQAYQKAGFQVISHFPQTDETWMVKVLN